MKNLIAFLKPQPILARSNMISEYNHSSVMKKKLGLNPRCRKNRTYADNFRIEYVKCYFLSATLITAIVWLAILLNKIL